MGEVRKDQFNEIRDILKNNSDKEVEIKPTRLYLDAESELVCLFKNGQMIVDYNGKISTSKNNFRLKTIEMNNENIVFQVIVLIEDYIPRSGVIKVEKDLEIKDGIIIESIPDRIYTGQYIYVVAINGEYVPEIIDISSVNAEMLLDEYLL